MPNSRRRRYGTDDTAARWTWDGFALVLWKRLAAQTVFTHVVHHGNLFDPRRI
ncbi:hypothetical protein [Prescottella equi]|uniref:hypothetical protein n=1 Tax=Rhodococcus hoagii TaxID=43767 RepID=UPI001C84B992|nr:hypothetical protein [Prescottella equi]